MKYIVESIPFINIQLIKGSRTFEKCLVSSIVGVISSYSLFILIQDLFHKILIISYSNIDWINTLLILCLVTILALSIFSVLEIIEDRGSGYNLFNKMDSVIRIVRKDIFGKKIFLTYPIKDADGIKVDNYENLKQRQIYLIMKDKRKIPIYPLDSLMSLKQIEKQAISIANFLELPCLI